MKKYDYIIIGGGIAGLSALHRVIKSGSSVLLLEKDSECGGLVKSYYKDDYLVETGPNAFLKSYKNTMEFVEELGLSQDVVFNIPGADNRFICKNDKIHSIPEGPISFLKTPLFSAKAKLRLLLEPFISRAKSPEESVYQFGKRRFGDEVSTTVMDAMVSGICAGDFRKLDIFSLFPKIGIIEEKFRSFLIFLLLFKLKSKEKNSDNESVTFRSLKDGMGAIAKRAYELYADNIIVGQAVREVIKTEDGNIVKTDEMSFQADNVIMASPANISSEILKESYPSLARELAKIPYSSITTCLLGYKKEQIAHPMNGFGFLIPRSQNKRILGGLFSSGLFENRAPVQMSSIKVYIGGAHDTEVQTTPDDKVLEEIINEITPLLSIEGRPIFHKINKIDSAIPQYNLGHQEIKKNIYAELAKNPTIFLVGNYLEGISVNEAIKSSEGIV